MARISLHAGMAHAGVARSLYGGVAHIRSMQEWLVLVCMQEWLMQEWLVYSLYAGVAQTYT